MSETSKRYFAYRSFWPELETMKKFREAGVNTICFFAANTVNSLGEPDNFAAVLLRPASKK